MISQLIDTFLSVAKTLNFTKSAEELCTTQPSVSRQISTLEQEWKLTLFERSNKGVRLTEEGALMFEACRRMESLLDCALSGAQSIRKGFHGTLNIGFLETLNEQQTLIPALKAFEDAYPNVRVNIEKQSYAVLREKLLSGQYDMIFTLNFDVENLPDIEIEYIECIKPQIILSENHPLYHKSDLSTRDFEHAVFVTPDPQDSKGGGDSLYEGLRYLGLTGNEILYAANMETLFFYLRTGKAVAVLGSCERDFYDPIYRQVELPELEGRYMYSVAAWRKDNRNSVLLRCNSLYQKQYDVKGRTP